MHHELYKYLSKYLNKYTLIICRVDYEHVVLNGEYNHLFTEFIIS